MKLSIYTMILPRLEVFFLEEWIEHNLKLGVDTIHIYDNGLTPASKKRPTQYYEKVLRPTYEKLQESEKMYKTDIRPLSDYFTDYTDTQIYDKLNSIVNKYKEVNIVSWRYGNEHTIVYPLSQASGYRNCVKNNKSDWWLHCDVDEYFILKRHGNFKELIEDYPNVCSFNFYQRRFHFRERNKSVREIYQCKKDFYLKYPKSLVDNKIYSFGAHNARSTGTKTKTFQTDEVVYFHHYLLGHVDPTECENLDLDFTMKKYL